MLSEEERSDEGINWGLNEELKDCVKVSSIIILMYKEMQNLSMVKACLKHWATTEIAIIS